MKNIRTSKFSKVIASYLAIQLMLTTVQPSNLFALAGGPAQPEFNSFTPIGTSDMVDLASGDFSYNIPVMDVGGYPLNLAYNSGINMDQEATWVGLGWNLNVGQINRQVRGVPDDFDGDNGDKITYENNIRDNVTVGATLKPHPAFAGSDLALAIGPQLSVEYNNYQGITFKPSVGISYQLSDKVAVGMNLSTSTTEGASVSPSVSIGETVKNKGGENVFDTHSNYGLSFNSRRGITGLSIYNNLTKSFNAKPSKKGKYRDVDFSLNFATDTYTPKKRNPYKTTSIGFNASIGGEVFLGEFQGEIYGYASVQKMKDKVTQEKTYGYEHTEKASKHDVLDFNRENDRVLNKNTSTLPVPIYTYDLYSINGQGIGGSFRPFRSQVGYVYDKYIRDFSGDGALGFEFGAGGIVHIGSDIRFSPSTSSTGLWESGNRARYNFIEKRTDNAVDYEKVYFKSIGDLNVDKEFQSIFSNKLGGYEPIRIGVGGFEFDKKTTPNRYFMGVDNDANITPLTPTTTFSKIKRENRLVRKQAIQKLSLTELQNITTNYTDENKPQISEDSEIAKKHHTAGINILKEDGSRYLFNQPLYNTTKVESTFNVSGYSGGNYCVSGLATYDGENDDGDDSTDNNNGRDHFFNRITTPSYVHTYLLSSVLSTDYEDLTNDGPTDDDLGTYTKFIYKKVNDNYKWRVPFQENRGTLNEGLNSLTKDQTASYNYGEKELMYIDKIETKTHVAVFDTNERNDGYGVDKKNGSPANSVTSSRMHQLNTISLYSKPEYNRLIDGDNSISPIKVAHFVYDYSLCKGIPNNDLLNDTEGENKLDANELNNQGGKLTLKEVYFTYRNSNMGKYTPYKFHYEKDYDVDNNGTIDYDNNPDYNIKAYNMWGNYKTNNGSCGANGETTNSEFPYVEQNKVLEDINATAWSMVKIDLPSGGNINIGYEADDYQYVQNKKALQMFKITGASPTGNETDINRKKLYDSSGDIKYIYIKIDEDLTSADVNDFKTRYIGDLENEVIYFRFLMNMIKNTSSKYDYVTGYFKIDTTEDPIIHSTPGINESYVAIPVQETKIEGGLLGQNVNPFSKAGWYFARNYLNRLAYSQLGSEDNTSVLGAIDDIVSQIKNITEIFKGPNRYLRDQKCANTFIPEKSWIRLQNPNGKKLGGGIRVAKIEMNDEWDKMTGNEGNDVYKMNYGQEYDYTTLEDKSSGVATYEPQGGKENPFITPFDDEDEDRLLAPSEKNYVEGPLGSSFFPAAKVTYGRVTVKNLQRIQDDGNGVITSQVKKHATGKVVKEFYTSRDFPTLAKHTVIDNHYNEIGVGASGAIASFFNLNVYQDQHLALSQGFTVIVNDMDGKIKSQRVFPESALGDQDAISVVEYKYHTKANGELENELQVYNKEGVASKETIGVNYDVVNDFRTSNSLAASFGADFNLAVVPAPSIPPVFWLGKVSNIQFAVHRRAMRTAATTKVIYKTGILKEKVAYDLGSSVSTKNLVYDASTGEILLTETTNEFKERYYNFNYPAYWAYNGMGQASNNLGLEVGFQYNGTSFQFDSGIASEHLIDGDVVWLENENTKAWVVNVGALGINSFDLMDSEGVLYEDINGNLKVIRSGYRNLHTASMSSVTSMKNPLQDSAGNYQNINNNTLDANNDWNAYRVINTSAILYSDAWPSQCECGLPLITFDENDELETNTGESFNPYRYNVKGDWRAKSSYAYLSGRHNGSLDPNPRNSGFLLNHTPFYRYNNGNWYTQSLDPSWTYASEVTEYSPYGAELENKDALDRYSSAQYGYNYTFPSAVSSNSKYQEMGYDSFEDTDMQCEDGHFNFKKSTANYGGVEVSREESHSGRTSIKINPNNIATIESRLIPCDEISSGN